MWDYKFVWFVNILILIVIWFKNNDLRINGWGFSYFFLYFLGFLKMENSFLLREEGILMKIILKSNYFYNVFCGWC